MITQSEYLSPEFIANRRKALEQFGPNDYCMSAVAVREVELIRLKDAAGGAVARFVVSSDKPDLAGDIITKQALAHVAAGKPVVALLHHDRTKIAGAWADYAFNREGELEADLHVVKDAPAGAELQALIDSGIPLAASVGFSGKGRKNAHGGLTFDAINLKEISVVAIGCNPDAMRVKSEGIARAASDQAEALRLAQARAAAAAELTESEGGEV